VAADSAEPLTLRYFPILARGLGPALVCEYSGLKWAGNADSGFTFADWPNLKATTPFGQLPLLTTSDGKQIGQTLAIINYVAKLAGAELEGEGDDFVMSQMLMSETEDLYSLAQKFVPTMFAKLGSAAKGTHADYDAFWAEKLPAHLEKLEALCMHKGGFTSSGCTAGELYLFSMLYQLSLVKADCLAAPAGKQPGALATWFATTLSAARTQTVLTGVSSMGPLKPYFEAAAPEETMAEVGETGVKFDSIAREWRCKWSEDEDKASLRQAQALLQSHLAAIKKVGGVKEVKRTVCGSCHDLKVGIVFEKAKYDESVGGLEATFLAELGAIGGISHIETQTMTFMTL